MTKKTVILASSILLLTILTTIFLTTKAKQPIKVGVLFSLSGTMSMSEIGVSRAVLIAIDEINQNGGILGRQLKAVVADGASDPQTFAKEAQKLIQNEDVKAIFGCWTSASRKEVKQIVEKHDSLLFYPVQYEGAEESTSIVYLGLTPNQQILPAMNVMGEKFGKKLFVVGSDYIFPRMAGEHIKDFAQLIGHRIVGQSYKKLGSEEFDDVIRAIYDSKPDYILNTLNGDSNLAFFKAYAKANLTSDKLPVMSFSISDYEIYKIAKSVPVKALLGQYASWSYFDTVDMKNSKNSLKAALKKQDIKHITDPMQTAYTSVYLYKQAVEDARSVKPSEVKEHIVGQTIANSGGKISISNKNFHAHREVMIGSVSNELEFDVIWSTKVQVAPEPFFYSKTKAQWLQVVEDFHKRYNGKWAAE